MPPADAEIRKAPGADKPQKLFDGGGLYLLTNPNGSRWRRWKFRTAGKEKLLRLGVYPEVTLKAAYFGGSSRESPPCGAVLRRLKTRNVRPAIAYPNGATH